MTEIVIVPEEPRALIIVESLTPAALFVEGGTDPLYDRIKQEVMGQPRDISTKEGRAAIASLAYKIAKSKTFLDGVGKDLNEEAKAKAKAVDNERKRIWDKLEALQKEVRAPLTEWEEKEKQRVATHEMAIEHLKDINSFGWLPSSQDVVARIETLGALSGRDWEEYDEKAKSMIGLALEQLQDKLAMTLKAEEERAELERLRAELAERAVREAKEKAEAEEAERKRIAEAARAEEERKAAAVAEALRLQSEIEAEEKRKADIERERLQREETEKRIEQARLDAIRQAAEETERALQQERDRIAAKEKAEAEELARREADVKHRKMIEDDIISALSEDGFSADEGRRIVAVISRGHIPHLLIAY